MGVCGGITAAYWSQLNSPIREIKVKVKRPALRVRYRLGYFALPEQPLNEKQREAVMRDAVWSPLDATALGLTARGEAPDEPGAKALKLRVLIDPREITLQVQDGRWVGSLDILFVQRSAEGRDLGGVSQTLNMRLQRPRYEAIMRDGLILIRDLEIAIGADQLRVVVRDASSGALGSLSIPLNQPSPTHGG